MIAGQRKSGDGRVSGRRVLVFVVVISGHLGLWLLLLRPVIFWQDSAALVGNGSTALELRFTHTPHPSAPHLAPQTRHSIATAVQRQVMLSARSSMPAAVGQTTHVGQQLHGPASTHEVLIIGVPDTSANQGSGNDGGFLERLHKAQRSRVVHRVPGSDAAYAPGIHLLDPMKQGVGALMRTTQRAFGIASSHCIDVDVWRHLTAQELSARHISLGDVDSVDEKYRCNDPPGLHF